MIKQSRLWRGFAAFPPFCLYAFTWAFLPLICFFVAFYRIGDGLVDDVNVEPDAPMLYVIDVALDASLHLESSLVSPR